MVVALRQPTPIAAEPHTIHASDGLTLHCDRYGDGPGPSVLFAHGFGQSRHAWSATAQTLAARGYRCFAADGRGHGDSGWLAGGRYAFAQFLDDVRTLAAHAGPRPIWVGASMGGLLGMVAEAAHGPGLFSALVLVDVTPSWEPHGVERIMRFMRARPEGFASPQEAHAAVRAYLPHRVDARGPQRLEKLLVRMPNGRLRWHWDPALLDSVAHEVQGLGARLQDAARALRLPVLLISGGRSDVVSTRTIDEFLTLVPHAQHRRVADATHMVAGDDNERFTALIAAYLDDLGGRRTKPAERA
jgi:pimeloyl-ACP methyl ester carboxylesterase